MRIHACNINCNLAVIVDKGLGGRGPLVPS
jgi:hypothetical protein